ncbi:MAG: response regulator transcription factor [Clostridiales bacterium]|nr:response regulator transcription factor [Clostridiales bacterium]
MNVVLIEDQNLLSSTLVEALEQDAEINVVAHSDKAVDVMQLCSTYRPDVVIMDVFTKEGNGIECTARVKKTFPDIKVMIMTGVEDDALVRAAEEAGADLFVWKNLSLAELIEFIHAAKKPYRIFPSVSLETAPSITFSDMDVSILRLLSKGKTSREIASELFLSYGTVRLYISRMYTNTGLKSRAQLVTYALRCGLIGDD